MRRNNPTDKHDLLNAMVKGWHVTAQQLLGSTVNLLT